MKRGNCVNYNHCELALSDKIIDIEILEDKICKECGEPLVEISKKKSKQKFNWFRRAKREGVCTNDKNCDLALSDKVIKIYTKDDVVCKECHSMLEIRKIVKKKRNFKKVFFWIIIIGILGYTAYINRYKITIPEFIESFLFTTPKEFTKQNIETFFNELIDVNEQDDAKETLYYYAPISTYYKYKSVNRDYIYKTKLYFYKKYPKREFKLGDVKVIRKNATRCEIERDITYKYESPSHKIKEGFTKEFVVLKHYLNTFEIVSIKTIK